MTEPLNRLELMTRHFTNAHHFANFLGVTPHTLWRWMSGEVDPPSSALRLLAILERLEGSDLHTALVEQARPPVKVKPVKVKRVRRAGVSVYSDPSIPSPVVKRASVWDDSYWYDRSLTRAEMDAGEYPLVDDWSEATARMNDAAYARYNDTCNAYLRRTGRVMPS